MNQVYSKLLSSRGHGYPLYIPEPNENLPYEYRQRGISIGDVGIITSDGGFDFLFNVCLSATDPINNDNVPEGFVPLVLDQRDIFRQSHRHSPGAIISSARDFNSGLTVELSKGLLVNFLKMIFLPDFNHLIFKPPLRCWFYLRVQNRRGRPSISAHGSPSGKTSQR